MSTLAELALLENGLPVTAWMEKWRRESGVITEAAIIKTTEVIRTDFASGRRSDGSGRFRPSMIGNPCLRAQVFSFLGTDQRDKNPDYLQMADAGSWLHYKWQAEGLSAGWLTDIEVQIDIPEWNLRGSVDGRMMDGSVFELKSVGDARWRGYRGDKGVEDWTTAKSDHIRQVHPYMKAMGTTAASIVYVNRDSNKYREFRVQLDPEVMQSLTDDVSLMQRNVAAGTLPVILTGCRRVMRGDILEECSPAEVKAWTKQHSWCDYAATCQARDEEGK